MRMQARGSRVICSIQGIARSDLSAFGALNAAMLKDLQVTQGIAVAGFGAYKVGEYALPGITTVDGHAYKIGTEVAQVILAVLAGQQNEKTVMLRTKLLVRRSTA